MSDEMLDIKTAVLGAGVMGCDLALDLALHGYNVILYDNSDVQIKTAGEKITRQFRLFKMMNPSVAEEIEDIISKIKFTPELDGIEEAGFIVENIVENWEEKKKLYSQISSIINKNAVVAANTSCIPISKIAALMKNPANVIGTHFMNPVPFKKFVEVIKGKETSDDVVNKTRAFLKTLDKKTVVVKDAPGFVSNRVLMLTINESIKTVEEGTAKPADVDKVFKLGFSHAMGPLATGDLIGLDTIMYSLQVLYDELGDAKFKPCSLLTEMVKDGKLGKKSGEGFFKY